MSCKKSDKPIVYYKFGKNKAFQQVTIGKGNIEVRVNKIRVPGPEPVNAGKCWRFLGMTLCVSPPVQFEALAWGSNPSWDRTQSAACPQNGGLSRPMIDGRYLDNWREYGAKSGTESVEEVPTAACTGSGKETCELEVLHRGSSLFKKQGECPCVFEVKCSAGDCPEGHLKCPCNRPPGYCCIPCSEVSSQLSGIKGALR